MSAVAAFLLGLSLGAVAIAVMALIFAGEAKRLSEEAIARAYEKGRRDRHRETRP